MRAMTMILFIDSIKTTRAFLINIYAHQVVSIPAFTYNSLVTKVLEDIEGPIFVSDSLSHCNQDVIFDMPRLSLFIVFECMELTFENGMIISVIAAKRFKYTAYHFISLPSNLLDIPTIGTILHAHSRPWWQNMDDGFVDIQPKHDGTVTVMVMR